RLQVVTLTHKAHDAAGDKAGNLHHANHCPLRGLDGERLTLVVFRGLVEFSIEESSRYIGKPRDAARGGGAIDMNVEAIHENGNAQGLLARQVKLWWRDHGFNGADTAIGGGNHQILAQWRHPRGITEEVSAPSREQDAKQRQRPEMQQLKQ